MTAAQISEGTFGDLAISSESASASVADRCRMTSVARSSPTATRNAAAFLRPPSLAAAFGAAGAVGGAVIVLVLAQPLADLGGDALGLALHQLVELVHARVGLARRQHRGRGAGLELGEPDRSLDL